MKFTFCGIQYKAIKKYDLSSEEIFILSYMKDVMGVNSTLRHFIGKEVYFYISPTTLMKQLFFLKLKKRTYQRRIERLVKIGIIFRKPVCQIYKGLSIWNQYYRFPKEVFVELFSRPRSVKTDAPNYNTNN